MQTTSRRRIKAATTPDASTKSARKGKRTSGTSSIDTKEGGGGRDKKAVIKSTFKVDLCRAIIHLLFVVFCIFAVVVLFEGEMVQNIEWEKPHTEEPQLRKYYGASVITKDFDCSILARRCIMGKRKLRSCFLPALMCVSMLRPDMFVHDVRGVARNQPYYVNARHVTSSIDKNGKKQETFNTYHANIKRPFIIRRLQEWDRKFVCPLTNSKGMPRDNQLFFIPWELVDEEFKYKAHLDYVDLNMDEVPDCIQPKVNTDVGRRDWIRSMNWTEKEGAPKLTHASHFWRRDTVQRTERFRVDTVPGFAGAFVKKIIEAATALMETEIAHSVRAEHAFTDDMLLLIYRHALINALKNPYMLLFDTDRWTKEQDEFNPEALIDFTEKKNMPVLSNVGASISFLFAAHRDGERGTKLPDTLAVTISEAKAQLGKKAFDLNVPIRVSNGLSSVEIVSSAQGERAFHAGIVTALRIMLRLRLYKDDKTDKYPDLNDVLHIPMAFYSMEERKMIFDRYEIKTPLRDILCRDIAQCATPNEQHSIDWQTRFNGTTAIQYNGSHKLIMSRIDTTQDKRNYAVGF